MPSVLSNTSKIGETATTAIKRRVNHFATSRIGEAYAWNEAERKCPIFGQLGALPEEAVIHAGRRRLRR